MSKKHIAPTPAAAAVVRARKTIRACAGFADDGYGGIQLLWRDIPIRRAKATKGKRK